VQEEKSGQRMGGAVGEIKSHRIPEREL